MYEITRKLSNAYWPRTGLNESADRTAGNVAVDKCTLGELTEFFAECQTGPTFCIVAEHVAEQLKKFPPGIENKRLRVIAAFEEAKRALNALNTIAEDCFV